MKVAFGFINFGLLDANSISLLNYLRVLILEGREKISSPCPLKADFLCLWKKSSFYD
jgi:hypothetical protein